MARFDVTVIVPNHDDNITYEMTNVEADDYDDAKVMALANLQANGLICSESVDTVKVYVKGLSR